MFEHSLPEKVINVLLDPGRGLAPSPLFLVVVLTLARDLCGLMNRDRLFLGARGPYMTSLRTSSWIAATLFSAGVCYRVFQHYQPPTNRSPVSRKGDDHDHDHGRRRVVVLELPCAPDHIRTCVKHEFMIEKTLRALDNTTTLLILYLTSPNVSLVLASALRLFNDVVALECGPEVVIDIVPQLPNAPSASWSSLIQSSCHGDEQRVQIFSPRPTLEDLGLDHVLGSDAQGCPEVQYQSYAPDLVEHCFSSRQRLQFMEELDQTSCFREYATVVCGGTFDHFHAGHAKLLLAAASLCRETLIVGVTSKAMLSHKQFATLIESELERMTHVRRYVEKIRPRLNVRVELLSDGFGPAILEQEIDAIVVSSETIKGGVQINERRQTSGLKLLEIHVIRRPHASSLSSTHIRQELAQQSSVWTRWL